MKNIGVTLIVTVLVALVGLGWLITEINFRLNASQTALSEQIPAYRDLGADLAAALDQAEHREDFIAAWTQRNALPLTLAALENFPIPAELRTAFLSGDPLILESEGNVSLHYYLPDTDAVLSLVVPEDKVPAANTSLSLVLTLLFYCGVIAVIGLWLTPLIRRLVVLSNTARAFGQGNFSSRIRQSRFSYIGGIEDEFNRMAEKIETLIGDNKVLSQAVSHNLKTPLARLRFGLEAWEETGDDGTRAKYLHRIYQDLSEMESLVETLLQFAQLETSTIRLEKTRIELGEYLGALFYEIDQRQVKIEYSFPGREIWLVTDPSHLAILLNNIMDNALAHATDTVKVSVGHVGRRVRVSIEDNGPGIPAHEREAVLQPFYRGKGSRNSNGHGMGLALAGRIAAWLDAALVIGASATLGGAAIHLQFGKPD